MVETVVTQADLLSAVIEALEAASADDDVSGALRAAEIAEELGISRGRTLKFLRKLLAEGRLEETRKRTRKLGGVMGNVEAYRLLRETTEGE